MQSGSHRCIVLHKMTMDTIFPAYNVQVGVADEYIAVVDVNQYCRYGLFYSTNEQVLYYIWLLSEVPSGRCRIWFLQ